MISLRITNVVCSGKLSFKLIYPTDIYKIIGQSKYYCEIVNENICPILSFRFKKENITVYKKKGNVVVSIWSSGSVNVVGVLSLKEAQDYANKVVTEVKKILKKNEL